MKANRTHGVRELRGHNQGTKSHRWVLLDQGVRDTFGCKGCTLRVEVPHGSRPARDVAKLVNGKPWDSKRRLPACSALRAPSRSKDGEDTGHIGASEWRDLFRSVADWCGEAWTREQLRLSGQRLTEAQELELLRLHAAVRVRLLDADDALEAVTERERMRRHEIVGELGAGHGGEQRDWYEGARRVPAAGGAA